MRIAVVLLGLAGGLLSAFFGYRWWQDSREGKEAVLAALSGAEPADTLAALDRRARAFPFLLAGLPLALGGAALAWLGRPRSAAPLLLAAGAGPPVLNLPALLITAPLLVAGGLCFFVRPSVPQRKRP